MPKASSKPVVVGKAPRVKAGRTAKPLRLPPPERRLMILEAAIALFSENGFRGTTTRALAEKAGVSEPILYRHFPNKQDLYSAIIEYKSQRGRAVETVIGPEMKRRDDRAVFTHLGEFVLSRFRDDPSFIRLLLFSALEGHELTKMFFERRVLAHYASVAEYIRTRVAEGAFRAGTDPDLAARAFLGAIYHRALHTIIFQFEGSCSGPEPMVGELVSIFLEGIQAQ